MSSTQEEFLNEVKKTVASTIRDSEVLRKTSGALERTTEKLEILHESVVRIEANCGNCRGEVGKLSTIVRGDAGKNGLSTQVAVLRRLWLVGSAILTVIIGVMLLLVKARFGK
jgi:hypothetical protein